MRIGIMGSGGLGGYFGAKLAQGGADVHFIARGRHLEAPAAEVSRDDPRHAGSLRVLTRRDA